MKEKKRKEKKERKKINECVFNKQKKEHPNFRDCFGKEDDCHYYAQCDQELYHLKKVSFSFFFLFFFSFFLFFFFFFSFLFSIFLFFLSSFHSSQSTKGVIYRSSAASRITSEKNCGRFSSCFIFILFYFLFLFLFLLFLSLKMKHSNIKSEL